MVDLDNLKGMISGIGTPHWPEFVIRCLFAPTLSRHLLAAETRNARFNGMSRQILGRAPGDGVARRLAKLTGRALID